ncbi:MAG: hypothetical protein JKY89_10495 [Immundisolibacteraceae bacterium]|nr:hypothetical protein [Immundisolibacteraceae bacterium]
MNIRKRITHHFINWLLVDKPFKGEIRSCFDRLQNEVHPGDVILIEGRSRISEIIKSVTRSPWSHAVLYLGRLHDIQDHLMRQKAMKYLGNANEDTPLIVEGLLGRGFIISPLHAYKHNHLRICRPTGITYTQVQHVINHAISSLGKAYNTKHFLSFLRFLLPYRLLPRRFSGILFKKKTDAITEEICSSGIARAFQSIQISIQATLARYNCHEASDNPSLFLPCDFDYSPCFEIVKYPMLQKNGDKN